MPTTFYPLNRNIGIATYNRFADSLRGTGSATIGGTTTTGDVAIAYFTTHPLVGFTLSGSISINVWGDEQNATTNYGAKCIVYKWNLASGLSAALATITTGEFATTPGVVTGSATPTSTVFANNDHLVFYFLFTPVGAGANNRTVNFYYNGATAAAQGDTYVTINENVTYSRRVMGTT